MKPVTICLLGVNLDSGNMGVNALVVGALQCIRNRWPDARAFLLDYGTHATTYGVQLRDGVVQVPLVNMRFSRKLYLRNHILALIMLAFLLNLIPSRRARARLMSRNACLREICECDFACSIAGGDSFSDIYGFIRLLYVGLPQMLVLLVGKKLILLPQTIGPFRSALARAFARWILRRSDAIYTRDHAGLEKTKQLLGPRVRAKLKFAFDLGFTVEPIAPAVKHVVGLLPESPANSRVVGFNVSGLLFMGGYNQKNMFGLSAAYDKLTYRLVDWFIAQNDAPVLLLPHVFGAEAESDASICSEIFEQLRHKYPGKIGYAAGAYNQSEIKHLIGTCDFFVGARMHACIAAVSQSVPAVPVAYSDKFIGVMGTLGIQNLVVDPRTMTEDEIVRRIGIAYSARGSIRRDLQSRVPEVKRAALELFKEFPANGSEMFSKAAPVSLNASARRNLPSNKPAVR